MGSSIGDSKDETSRFEPVTNSQSKAH